MVAKVTRYAEGLLEVFRPTGLAIHHHVAIQCPCLPPGPCRCVAVALMRPPEVGLAAQRIVRHHVVATVVRSEVVAHRGLRMSVRYLYQGRVACQLAHGHEELQVHQVVDDDRVLPAGTGVP